MADGRIVIDTEINEDGIRRGMSSIKSQIQSGTSTFSKTGDAMKNWGSNVVKTFAPAGVATGAFFANAIKGSISFEKEARRAATLTGGSYEDIKNAIFKMASTSVYSTEETASAMAELGAMGFDTSQAIDALPGILSAAAASGEDLGLVSSTVAAALNGFGLEASESGRVADVLAQSANQSAASVGDLQYAFKYAAPYAKGLGISMEELAAATGIMTDAGMEGSQAGTTLRMALGRLVNPPTEAATAMKELGFSAMDAKGNFKPLGKLLPELSNSMKGMTEAQKLSTLATIFGTEAASGMMTLLNSSDGTFQKMTSNLENSAGASEKASKSMLEGWAGAITVLASTWDVAQRALTDALAPAVQFVAQALSGLLGAFTNLSPSVRTIIAVFISLAGAFVMVMPFIGMFAMGLGGIMSTGIVAWLGGVISGFMGMIAPIALVIAAIAGFALAFVALYKQNAQFRSQVQSIWTAIQTTIQTVVTTISTVVMAIWGALVAWWSANQQTILTAAMTVWTFLYNTISSILTSVGSFIMSIWGQVVAWWTANQQTILTAAQNVWTAISTVISVIMPIITTIIRVGWFLIRSIIQGVWENIKGIIQGAMNVIMGIITLFSGLFSGNFSAMWDGIKMIFSGAVQFLWNAVQLLLYGRLIKGLLTFGAAFGSGFKTMWELIKQVFTGAVQGVSSIVQTGFQFIRSIATGFQSAFTSIMRAVWSIVKDVFNSSLSAIKSIFMGSFNAMRSSATSIMSAIRSVITSILNAIRAVFMAVLNAIRAVVTTVFNTIRSIITSVMNAVRSVVTSILNAIRATFSSIFNAIVNTVRSGGQNMLSAMRSAMSNIVSAVRTGVSNLLSAIRTGMSNAVSAITNYVGRFRDAGMQLMAGLVNAVVGKAQDLVNAVGNAVGGAIDKAKALLKIKSPSRVFREIGMFMMQGGQIGVEKNADGMIGAVADVARGVEESFDPTLGGVNPPDIEAGFGKYQGMAERHISGTMNIVPSDADANKMYVTVHNQVDEKGITSMVNKNNSKDMLIKSMSRKV